MVALSRSGLTRSSPSQRTRATFVVGRKKSVAHRTHSVRRHSKRGSQRSLSIAASRRKSSRLARLFARAKRIVTRSNTVDRRRSFHSIHRPRPSRTSRTPMGNKSDLPSPPPEPSDPAAQKSGTGILRRLTTRFRSGSAGEKSPRPAGSPPSPLPGGIDEPKRKKTLKLPSLPAPPKAQNTANLNSWTSLESRQAALRARGLIPAAPHPSKDAQGYKLPLSQQEARLDKQRSVLVQEPGRGSSDEEVESEAKKIREAWLRKNVEAQSDELPRASTSLSASQPEFLGSAGERASALAVAGDGEVTGIQQPSQKERTTKAQSPSVITSTSPDLQKDLTTTTTTPKPTVEPQDVPLPPSPTIAASDDKVAKWLASTPASPRSVRSSSSAYPQSPTESSMLPIIREDDVSPSPHSTFKSFKSKPSAIAVTAAAIIFSGSQSAPPSAVPHSSSSLPPEDDDSRAPRQSTLPTLSVSPPPSGSPPRGRSMTMSQVGTGSVAPSASTGSLSWHRVPTLSPSRTTASSFTNSELPPTPTTSFRPCQSSVVSEESADNQTRHAKGLALAGSTMGDGGLKIQTSGLSDNGMDMSTPVIVESPLDDGELPDATSPVIVKVVEESLPAAQPRPQKALTDKPERRRSFVGGFGLFGRSSTASPVPILVNEDSSQQSKSIRSMTNLRRSVAGTISSRFRPKTLVIDSSARPSAEETRDGPQSPSPSLLSPYSYSPSSPGLGSTPGVGPRPRMAVSPVIHDRGSIMLSTKEIEDAESRRLSEMAFLDF